MIPWTLDVTVGWLGAALAAIWLLAALLTWGWRCGCGASGDPTYATATAAQEAADAHEC